MVKNILQAQILQMEVQILVVVVEAHLLILQQMEEVV